MKKIRDKEKKDEVIQIRVSPERKKLLEAFAKAEGRTLSNYLEWAALERGVKNKDTITKVMEDLKKRVNA